MKFKIPFTFSDAEILRRRSKFFLKFSPKSKGKLDSYLKNCGVNFSRGDYYSICIRSFVFNFLWLLIISTSLLFFTRVSSFYLYGIAVSLAVSGFIFLNQINYPKIFSNKKIKEIEKNLIPLMQDMLVQLNSGVPLFKILMNISEADYGEASLEFKKITSAINSGTPQIEALEEAGKNNNSTYFRRVLWQISNGMRAGSDMSVVIREGIKNLSQEQAIQIQSYGSKLNPLIMFYMMMAVILPALGVTFLVVISSMLSVSKTLVQLMFVAIFIFVVFIQIMFLGIIKSRRPSLL